MGSVQSSVIDFYGKGVHFAKKYLSPQNLDKAEDLGSLVSSAALATLTTSFFINCDGIARISCLAASAVLGAYVGNYCHHRYIKAPFVEREIEGIVKKSKAHSHDKTALLIHTTQDHNGAFSYFHSVAALYERCAKNHSIDRIRGLTFEERQKVQGNNYDVIGLLAHGSPKGVNMDGDRVGFNIFRVKHLRFLRYRIKDGGIIFLDACKAAFGNNSLVQAVSREACTATVYGSTENIHAIVGAEYTDDMVPTYYKGGVTYRGENTTRIFRKGEEVKQPQASPLFI